MNRQLSPHAAWLGAFALAAVVGTDAGAATTIESAQNAAGSSIPAALVDDATVRCALPDGDSTVVVSFPTAKALDRFTVMNENAVADGEFAIAVANEPLPAASSRWTNVNGAVRFARKRQFDLSLVGIEARYLKLSFKVTPHASQAIATARQQMIQQVAQGGHVTFASHVSNAPQTQSVQYGFTRMDVAKLRAKARIVYVSSGSRAAARRMIDGNDHTTFRFAANDPAPTVIVEFANVAQIGSVTALYKAGAGLFDVYLLDELGNPPSDLSRGRLVQAAVESGNAETVLSFDPQGARYIALRWHGRDRVATTDSKDGKNGVAGRGLDGGEVNSGSLGQNRSIDLGEGTSGSSADGETLEIAEIGAIGDVPLSFVVSEAPDLYASNADLPPINGESRPDFSNKLGTLAEPPQLPEVSP